MSFDILPTELKQMIFKKRYDCMKDDKYKKKYDNVNKLLKYYFNECIDYDDIEPHIYASYIFYNQEWFNDNY